MYNFTILHSSNTGAFLSFCLLFLNSLQLVDWLPRGEEEKAEGKLWFCWRMLTYADVSFWGREKWKKWIDVPSSIHDADMDKVLLHRGHACLLHYDGHACLLHWHGQGIVAPRSCMLAPLSSLSIPPPCHRPRVFNSWHFHWANVDDLLCAWAFQFLSPGR